MIDDSDGVTTARRIESVHIKGFRSLADVNLDNIPNPMVLLGANGAGKSNILRFFHMLKEMFHQRLGKFVQQQGGADDQLSGGRRVTQEIEAAIYFRTAFGSNRFSFTLEHAHPDQFTVTNEQFRLAAIDEGGGESQQPRMNILERRGAESGFLHMAKSPTARAEQKMALDVLAGCMFYQFHDTSDASSFKTRWDVQDHHHLLEHGGNLASILIRLRDNDLSKYNLICKHIRRVLPEFHSFEVEASYGKVLLRWRAKTSDKTIGAHLTSDGSLRAFSLITLLNLPDELLPGVILLDEPELGLHPFAITLVSHMVKSLSRRRQVIVATQSPHFVDAFNLDEIVVLNMRNGRTEANRLSANEFSHWLEEYTTGELWRKNVLGGHP